MDIPHTPFSSILLIIPCSFRSSLYSISGEVESINRFRDTHPKVMEEWIKRLNWDVELDK